MADFLTAHAKEIWSFVVGLVGGGIGGSLITLRITRNNRVQGHGTSVDQSRSMAGGDLVGRDKFTSSGRR